MLLAIKDRITGIIAWFVVILISVPFILWGVQEYTGIGSESYAIKVNDTEISMKEFDREMSLMRQQMLQSFGGRMPSHIDAEAFIRTQTIAKLTNRALFEQLVDDYHYRIPPQQILAAITSDPAFQANGQFDKQIYADELRSRGMSQEGYEKQVRDQMLMMQVQNSISKSAFITPEEIAEYAKLRYQNRNFEYIRIPLAHYRKKLTKISEQEIENYYKKNSGRYKTAEKVKIEYIELSLAAMADKVNVSDAELKALYSDEVKKGRFASEEKRSASHILIKVPADADEDVIAEKRAEIEALRERIMQGESFAAVAKEASEDPGSAANGGDLGEIQVGTMVKPFENVVFAAELNVVSQPVKTPFGFHLIKVNKIIAPEVQSFEEVKSILEKEYRRSQVEGAFYDKLDDLANAAFENPDDLSLVADIVGSEVKSSDWFTAAKGDGIASHSEIRDAAFSDEVLKNGTNSAPIEVEPEHVVVLHVAEHEPSRQQTLEEAREQITESIKEEKAEAALNETVETVLTEAKSGMSLQKLAPKYDAEYKAVESNRDDAETPREIIQKVFAMHPSSPMDKGTFSNGDAAVIKLNKVENTDIKWLKDDQQEKLTKDLVRARGQYDLVATLEDLKENAKISLHSDLQSNSNL